MKPRIGGGGDGGDGSDGGTPRPIQPPPPKTGGGGTVIPPPPPIYRAADGSPVSVQLFADGQVQSAEATGKDGILRRYSMSADRSVQTFSEGALPPLTLSVGLVKQRGVVRLTGTADSVQLVYEIFCTNPEDAPPASADFQVTATRLENGTKVSQDIRSVVGSNIPSDYESTFGNVLGVEYVQLILFFEPVLRTVVVPRPATAQDRSVWAKLGRGVVWGIATLVGGFVAAPAEGLGLLAYFVLFGLGFCGASKSIRSS